MQNKQGEISTQWLIMVTGKYKNNYMRGSKVRDNIQKVEILYLHVSVCDMKYCICQPPSIHRAVVAVHP